jgi:hypothetical protein
MRGKPRAISELCHLDDMSIPSRTWPIGDHI